MPNVNRITPFAERLMVIADGRQLLDYVRRRYPNLEVTSVPSYMSGIAELANGPVRAVLGYVDPGFSALEQAVGGLRQAVGERVPLILCCDPEAEPLARRALPAGASDYVIYPPDPVELDALLALSPAPAARQPAESARNEMQALNRALASMSDHPQRVLNGLAELLATALHARFATVIADGVVTTVGEADADPVISEQIVRHHEVIGEVAVGARKSGAYQEDDIEKLRHYAGLFSHVIHTTRKQHDLQRLALTDDLTHLPNRRYLLQFLEEVLQRAARERSRVTVCMFDIDDFKTYNDHFGHDAGDEILKAGAQLFQKHCRPEDVVARYGGDEFVVVFWDSERPRVSGSQHPSEAIAVMKRFQQALNEHEFDSLGPHGKGQLTISGGLATYPWDASTVADLLRRADQALLEAKMQGKNRFLLVGS